MPRISIVTPSFNQGAFLEETLVSVLGQRPELHEYFVLDGGSSDQSRTIIEKYADRLTAWRSERDGGQAAAIEAGFRMASGDVLGWINSDDVLLPGALRLVRQMFTADPGLKVVVGGCYFIDADSRVLRVSRVPRQTLRAARWGVIHVPQPACFFRRDLYDEVGGMDQALTCVLDTELWCRMLRVAPRWGRLDAVLAGFRVHPASKGQSWSEQYRQEHELLRARYPDMSDRGLRAWLGVTAYRLSRSATLGYLRDHVESRRMRGRLVSELSAAEG